MDEKNIYPNQDICFSYFSEDDMEIVLAEQEYQRELKQFQDEANWELTDIDSFWTYFSSVSWINLLICIYWVF